MYTNLQFQQWKWHHPTGIHLAVALESNGFFYTLGYGVYYIYNETRVCPRLGAARADPPLSRMYPQGQCCLGTNLAGATLPAEG